MKAFNFALATALVGAAVQSTPAVASDNTWACEVVLVRRQNIWRRSRRKLVESGPRLGIDIRRRAFGAASADIGWSVV